MNSQFIEIRPRFDTKRNWENNSLILRAGELAIGMCEDRSLVFKIGDGVNQFNKLSSVKPETAFLQGAVFCNGPYSQIAGAKIRLPELPTQIAGQSEDEFLKMLGVNRK